MTNKPSDNQSLWDQHAASDPLWAVLAFPEKRGGRWPLQEFMKTGEREIALLFHRFAELQLPAPCGQALDFGCGVGRLSQALARRLDRVVGADISPAMIDLARRLNRYADRVRYVCTAETGLETLPAESFQCIYSNIVLQHVPSALSVHYLHEFFRLLARGGLLVFQLPSHRESPVEAEIKAMPDAAYKAAIRLSSAVPLSVRTSAELPLTLLVRNTSEQTWQQPHVGPLALGNHWLDAAGDLVHEGVSWFGHKGSPTLRFAIEVTRDGASAGPPATAMIQEYPIPDYPEGVLPAPPPSDSHIMMATGFPMDGVPRAQVMDIIRAHGGRLAYLEEDRRAGPEWVSYRYFVAGRS